MTTQTQTTTSPETAPASEPPRRDATRPTHRFWLVQGEGKDARWTELCALWPTKNGKGLYASMRTILPLFLSDKPGRLVVLPASFKAPEAATGGAQ